MQKLIVTLMKKSWLKKIEMNNTALNFFTKKASYLLAGILMLLLSSGCTNNDMTDLDVFVEETRLKFLGKIDALPAITPYESYTYNAYDKRNPFKSPVKKIQTAVLKTIDNDLEPNSERNKEDLEKYELSALSMVGIMNNNGQNWAIVKSPDQSIFRVKKGNYIGTNNGKIISISESKIELQEIVKNEGKKWVERKNILAISE